MRESQRNNGIVISVGQQLRMNQRLIAKVNIWSAALRDWGAKFSFFHSSSLLMRKYIQGDSCELNEE